jgi:predicted metal-dependent hydrolase
MAEEVEAEFWQGVEQFNQQQFYACHDTLEAIWMEAMEPQRSFYQGVLQIAVALYHLGNQNLRGAVILLGEGINRLRRYQPTYASVDVAALVNQSTALLTVLQQADPVQVQKLAKQVEQADAASASNDSAVSTNNSISNSIGANNADIDAETAVPTLPKISKLT